VRLCVRADGTLVFKNGESGALLMFSKIGAHGQKAAIKKYEFVNIFG
jgi:hypothetical protein